LLEDSRGNVIPPIGSRETTREQQSPNTTHNSEPDPTRNPWEDPEIQGTPIPAEHKALVDSLQAAIDDAAWVINSNTGAKMSGEAFEQFKSQADIISRTLGTLTIGAPIQAVPELRPYFKYADAVCRRLASLVVQLRNDVHNQTIASERLREAVGRHGLAKDRTSSPVRHKEHAARPAELGLRHYMKRLSPNQFPSLASLKDPENLRLVVEVDLPQIKSNIEECKKVLHTYSSLPDANPEVIEDAITAWTRAHEWTEEVVAQFCKQKLNFDQKQPAREVNFKPWTTSGEVNVYEFFTKFEEWSAGTLSENQKAY
jgi:hypothetical protein